MLKKILLGALLLMLLLSVGLFLWARAVFTEDAVRTALADQLSKALGQPVKVASIAATIYPRVTVNLQHVTIGEPARIQVRTLHVGTAFRALLLRRIEHVQQSERLGAPLVQIKRSAPGPGVRLFDDHLPFRRSLRRNVRPSDFAVQFTGGEQHGVAH